MKRFINDAHRSSCPPPCIDSRYAGQLVYIQPGSFKMGSPKNEPGRSIVPRHETRHQVTLTKGFYIGKYQITQAQYKKVMKRNPSFFKTSAKGDDPKNRPAERVSWYDAVAFCNKLSMIEGLTPAYRIGGKADPDEWGTAPDAASNAWNVKIAARSNGYRLPTEAQWEYACRAGATAAFSWGKDTINNTQANYFSRREDASSPKEGKSLQRTTKVGKYRPNPWGLYDMHGNVLEWCWDWYAAYPRESLSDPCGPASGANRVLRGGSWLMSGHDARSASRSNNAPFSRISDIGFRIIRF